VKGRLWNNCEYCVPNWSVVGRDIERSSYEPSMLLSIASTAQVLVQFEIRTVLVEHVRGMLDNQFDE